MSETDETNTELSAADAPVAEVVAVDRGVADDGGAAAISETATSTIKTVGIKFDNSPTIYCFRAEGLELHAGDKVIVESELGVSMGRVVHDNHPPDASERELKHVLRKATTEDIRQIDENTALNQEAKAFCTERIEARGLPMKLLTVDSTLDRKRLIFYFISETRIDFRELVKDLASKYRTRIELRQIGVRDASKMVGGLGICGREFCCSTFLRGFAPISIKMAKQQDLVLNTGKLSGGCGRLMCCLNYEYDDKKKGRAAAAAAVEGEAPAVKQVSTETEERTPALTPEQRASIYTLENIEESSDLYDKLVTQDERDAAAEKKSLETGAAQPQQPRHQKHNRRHDRHRRAPKPEQGTSGVGGVTPAVSSEQPRQPRPPRPEGQARPDRQPRPADQPRQPRPPRPEGQARPDRQPRPADQPRQPRPPRPDRPHGDQPRQPRPEGTPRPAGAEGAPQPQGPAQEGGQTDSAQRRNRRRRFRRPGQNRPEGGGTGGQPQGGSA